MKKAIDLKVGNKIKVGGEVLFIEDIEVSDAGKHGTKKVRIKARKNNEETIVLIRPSDYPIKTVE